ncbi:universal stress protein [Natronomonas sp.]|uniref:universal stress protein n=1 Tax=Natronomonas sp. TaxID=2184060 RepID=UPI002FC31747
MFHVAMAVSADDEGLAAKVETVADLPGATEAVRVTLVHVHAGDDDKITDRPAVSEALERCSEAGLQAEAYGVVAENAPNGLVDAIETLDPDLVCLGGRHRSPAGKRQLKPGAQEVILQAGPPVVIAGELDHRTART